MANTLGTLLIVLEAQTDAFKRGLNDAKTYAFSTSTEIVSSLKQIGSQLGNLKFGNEREWQRSGDIIGGVLGGIAVAAAAATVVVAKQVSEQAKQISKLSESYGLSVESISQMRVVSELTGVSLEQLSIGMGRLARNAATAAEGGKQQTQAFQNLGVAVTDGEGHLRPMNDLIVDVAGKFAGLENGTGKTALAMQLFGRSGAALIPVLNQGSAGIKQLQDLSDQLGLTWNEQDIKAAADFHDRLELLDLKSTALKENFAKGFIPALDSVASAFISTDTNGKNLAKTLGDDVGQALIKVAEYLKTTVGEFEKLKVLLAGPTTSENATQFLSRVRSEFERINKEYSDFVANINKQPSTVLPHALGTASGAGSPTFSAAGKDDTAKLAELLNRARQEIDKTNGDKLQSQIENIQRLRDQIISFAAQHPEKIFANINDAVNKLNNSIQELTNERAAALQSIFGPNRAAESNLGAALSASSGVPTASGEIQQQSELINLTKDVNEQNRQRLEIYQRTRTPMEQYAEEVARINILYADKSSDEYTRAMRDATDRIREIYDPTVKYEREIERLNEARKAQMITDADYLQQLKRLQAQEAMEKLSTAPKSGIAGVGQGIGAGAQAVSAEWQGLAAETGNAMVESAHRMQTAFADAFTSMVMGTKTVGQAFAQLGANILGSIVETLAQMLAKWIVTHLIMAAITKALGTASAISEAVTGASTNAALATSAAFLGAANAYAFWAWNPPAAAAAASAALGIGMGFASSSLAAGLSGAVASAAGGMEVDRDQLAMVHKDEKILPARISRGFDAIIQSFNAPRAGTGHMAYAGAGGGGHTFNFHINGATDADAVGDQVMARVQKFFRTGGVMKK